MDNFSSIVSGLALLLACLIGWPQFLKDIVEEPGILVKNPLGDHYKLGDQITIDDGGTEDAKDDVVITLLNLDAQPPEIDPISGRKYSESETRNSASLVFKLTYGKTSFLFTGDINGRDKSKEAKFAKYSIDSEELGILAQSDHQFWNIPIT